VSNPVTFALVGAGGIAQSYAQAFENHPDAKLVAVADVRADAAQAIAAKFGAPAFASYQELLATGPKCEAVVICTPPNSHEDITSAFARAGVHVLCEKPFTLTGVSARRMAEAARRAGVLLTMASKFRYVDDVTRAKELIAAGEIGDVVLWENAFTGRVEMGNRWNSNPDVAGGGVLIDNGTHSVDLMRYFLGPLAEVHAVEGKRVQQLAVEDTVRVFVRSAAGVVGNVDLSWSINKELDWYVTVFGSAGVVQVGWRQSRIKRANGPWEVFGGGYQKTGAFRNQLANFARAIRGTESLVITFEDAIASVDVIEAAYRSLRSASWTGVTLRTNEPTRSLATDSATAEAAHA
jgi:predicted dehydrogenase